jgi:hypothetical protein
VVHEFLPAVSPAEIAPIVLDFSYVDEESTLEMGFCKLHWVTYGFWGFKKPAGVMTIFSRKRQVRRAG